MMQAENSKRNRTNSDEEDFAGFDESTLEEPTILLKRMRKYTPVVPDYKKPFLYGWKRELVYRATPGTSKDKGDVYYITPNGRKLRTKADIIAHLKDDLSIENFSFVKEPICGLNDGDEIIRMAKPLGKTNQKQPVTTNSASAKRITKSKRVEKKIKDQEAPVAISSDLHQEQASTGNEIPSDNAKPNQRVEEMSQKQCKKCLKFFNRVQQSEDDALDYTCELCSNYSAPRNISQQLQQGIVTINNKQFIVVPKIKKNDKILNAKNAYIDERTANKYLETLQKFIQ